MSKLRTLVPLALLLLAALAPAPASAHFGRSFRVEEATIADIQRAILAPPAHGDATSSSSISSASRPTTAPA